MNQKASLILFVLLIQFNLFSYSNTKGIELKLQNGNWSSLNRFFVTSLPGKHFDIHLKSGNPESILLSKCDVETESHDNNTWRFLAPSKSGNYSISFIDTTSNTALDLTLFVIVPITKMNGEYLNGYRIGHYPDKSLKGHKNYNMPKGFIEVTKENQDLFLTPHFQLKQFLCKQASGYPKYVILNQKLLLKLEYLLAELNKNGRDIKTLFIMSGYRTPYYNKSLGNVKFSRHVFGDAADIYVDENHDNVIDDLNYDHKHSIDDEMVIFKIVNSFDEDPKLKHLVGGIGTYNKNSLHTYFIHIDTRGYKARW